MPIRAYAFDAYGTLFDVHAAIARHRAVIGFADVLRQLEVQRFRGIDIWMHTVTPGAERLAEGLGLEAFGQGDRRYYKHVRSGP